MKVLLLVVRLPLLVVRLLLLVGLLLLLEIPVGSCPNKGPAAVGGAFSVQSSPFLCLSLAAAAAAGK